MKTPAELHLRKVAFEHQRHSEDILKACIESSKAGFEDFKPSREYLSRLNHRLERAASNGQIDKLLLYESATYELIAMLWLEFLTYPDGYDGSHDNEPWPDLLGLPGAQIRNTWVCKRHLQRGLGLLLKRDAENIARLEGACFLYTRCAKGNAPIIALNRKLGYEMLEDGIFLRMRKLIL